METSFLRYSATVHYFFWYRFLFHHPSNSFLVPCFLCTTILISCGLNPVNCVTRSFPTFLSARVNGIDDTSKLSISRWYVSWRSLFWESHHMVSFVECFLELLDVGDWVPHLLARDFNEIRTGIFPYVF